MRGGKEILRLPAVDLSRGARLGTVKDLVIDLEHRAVVGLVLEEATLQDSARLIPFEAIRGVGPDAVTIQDASVVVSAAEAPHLQALYESPIKVIGAKVLTEEGRVLGTVSDVRVDERSGAILEYEVSAGPLHDLLSGRTYVPATAPRAVGGEFMVVPEAVAAGRGKREELPPLVREAPRWSGVVGTTRDIDRVATEAVERQVDLVVGLRALRTLTDEDAGGVIVFEGETITEETIERAKAAGKLNLLVEAAGPLAAQRRAARGLWDQVSERVGWLTGRR